MQINSTLVLNVGSSSVKVAVFQDGIRTHHETVPISDANTEQLVADVDRIRTQQIVGECAIGHRVVHGGRKFTAPVRINSDVLTELDRVAPFAPLHMPPVVKLIRSILKRWPDVPQVACFDTAFHRTMPIVEQRFGIPRKYHDAGIRRYGFHGLSYQSIAAKLPGISELAANGRTIVCHLGNGSSLCGMIAGKSETTTMGFSPLDGLLMGTRCGRIDPGVLLYLLHQEGMTSLQVGQLLESGSGLLGVSGISADMRLLLDDPSHEAAEAIELFCYMAAKEIGAATVAIGGLDAIVFTAGIGENCPAIRKRICTKLEWLGASVDDALNDRHATRFHRTASRVELLCVPTDEESIIAEQTRNTLTTEGVSP